MDSENIVPGLESVDLDANPFNQFGRWLQAAVDGGLPEPTAMTLATISPDGRPAARMVLLKSFDEHGFVFFTSYESDKAKELAHNPQAALVFYWAALHRQVRITGRTTQVSAAESDEYFKIRPRGHQISVLASQQSKVIPGRDLLEARVRELEVAFEGKEVPRPITWGGYLVTAETIEFWQGRINRLHDRFRYTHQPDGSWFIERLAP
jgi:pyridoxamine 5'-phosphate oxidase